MTWGAVALATAGLGVLTLDGFSVGYGEALTFVAAVLYALHIVGARRLVDGPARRSACRSCSCS